jgi:uncharacterized membrane protein YcaP (DUF421 family)
MARTLFHYNTLFTHNYEPCIPRKVTPLVIVDHGKPLKKRMKKTQVDEEDILHVARHNQGLEKMEKIKYAVLEKDGTISIIPF